MILAVTQRAILFIELLHQRQQLANAHFKSLQLGVDRANGAVLTHLAGNTACTHGHRQEA